VDSGGTVDSRDADLIGTSTPCRYQEMLSVGTMEEVLSNHSAANQALSSQGASPPHSTIASMALVYQGAAAAGFRGETPPPLDLSHTLPLAQVTGWPPPSVLPHPPPLPLGDREYNSPPSPGTLADITMQELGQLGCVSWGDPRMSPASLHHSGHLLNAHSQLMNAHGQMIAGNGQVLTHDILNSALVLNNIQEDSINFASEPDTPDEYPDYPPPYPTRYDEATMPDFSQYYNCSPDDALYMEREDEKRFLAGSDEFYSGSSEWSPDSRLAKMALARCATSKAEISSESASASSSSGRNRSGGGNNNNGINPTKPKMQKNLRLGPDTRCSNCETGETSLWRRATNGTPICNACGLYEKLHNESRPLTMRRDRVQKRKRKHPAQGRRRRRQQPRGKSDLASQVSLNLRRNAPIFDNSLQDNMSSFCNFYDSPAAKDSSQSSRVQEKVFITSEEAEQGVNPMDINKGMRSYRCQSSSCRNLKFSSLDGPQGVREHMLSCHPEGSSSPPCRLLL